MDLIESLQLLDADDCTSSSLINTKASGQGLARCLKEIFKESAYIIDPDFSSKGSPLCDSDDPSGYFEYVNDVVQLPMLKPLIAIMNTSSKGAHWVCVVALPSLSPTEAPAVYIVDSLSPLRELPARAKVAFSFLYPGAQCTFPILPAGVGVQQVEGASDLCDCGWWAVYNAVQIVKHGNISYYKSFKTRNPGLMLRQCLDGIADLTQMKDCPGTPSASVGSDAKRKLYNDDDVDSFDSNACMSWIRSSCPVVNDMHLKAAFTKDKKAINVMLSEYLLTVRANAIENRNPWPADVLQSLAHVESFALVLDAESLDSSRMLIENQHFKPHEIIVTNPARDMLVITALRDTPSATNKQLADIRIVPLMLLKFIESIPQKGPIFHFVYLDYVQSWFGRAAANGCQPVKEVERLFKDRRFMPNSFLAVTVTSLSTRFGKMDCISAPADVITFGQQYGYTVCNIHNKYFKSYSTGSCAGAMQMLLMLFVVYLPTPFMPLQKLASTHFLTADVLESKDTEIELLKSLLAKTQVDGGNKVKETPPASESVKEEASDRTPDSKSVSTPVSSSTVVYRWHPDLLKAVCMTGQKLGKNRSETRLKFKDTKDTERLEQVSVATFNEWELF